MIQVTPKAAEMLRYTLRQQQAEDKAVRILVHQGGCNCSRYRMAIGDAVREDDRVLEIEGLKIVVDPQSASLLEGAVVDFIEEPHARGFVIQGAPKEAAHGHHHGHGGCGCGGH